MPRRPDPGLEDRILHAADVLWRRGGERALTMRAVAEAAHTNTPAVYRRFKNRQDLLRGLLLSIAGRTREYFEQEETLEHMAEAYVDQALRMPNDYTLFYSYSRALAPKKAGKRALREFRPNFALLERLLAKQLGGSPEDHTHLALALWALLHGTTMLLLSESIPEEHAPDLRKACRAAVKHLLGKSATKRIRESS